MTLNILPQEGNFASNFGSGLGQGLSQQLPEEIKRYRLQSGLNNLREQNITDPYQLVSKLATIPGIDPGLIGILAPLLQNQIGRKQAEGGLNFQDQPSIQGLGTPTHQTIPYPEASQGTEPRLTPQGANAPQQEPLNQLALNLLRSQPFNYPNIQSATTEAERRIENVESELNKQFQSFLQKDQSLQQGEIGGDVRDLMRQRAIQDLARTGASERSIAQKYARQGKEIAQEYSALRKIHDSSFGPFNVNQSTIKSIRGVAKRLSDLGVPQDQILDNTATDLNIAKGAASYLLNPLHGTEAGRYMHSIKPNSFIGPQKGDPERKFAEKVATLILNNPGKDLIGSLAYIAQQKGYNGRKFVAELQQLLPDDKITTTQSRDLANQKLIPSIPTLSQGWLMGWSGENKEARK